MEEASTSAAGRVIDRSLDDAKTELKKSVQQLLIQNLRKRNEDPGDERRNRQLVRVASVGAIRSQNDGQKGQLSSDSQVANYLRERGYEYTLSVLMAEANVPDSKLLKSIATRLNDSRSRLVVGNPDFQAAILQIWDETEKKYNEKLRQYIIDWELKQTMQLQQMERMLRRRLGEEEQEMKRHLSNRLAEIETKEKEWTDVVHERAAAFEQRADQDKRQLLADARELDGKRQDLQSLETEFYRQVDTEQTRIRTVKDNLNHLSAELKRQQLQLTFQMDEAVKEARRQEQVRYAEKLQQISRKEEKIREIIEKAKNSRSQADALKFMLNERDSKVQELEMIVQQYKNELMKFQDKVREKDENLRRMNDYQLLKTENQRIKDETRTMREELTREKLFLQQRNYDLEAKCRELIGRMDEWAPNEENPFKKELNKVKMDLEKSRTEWKVNESHYRKQLEDEKSKNDQLKLQLDDQTGRSQSLVEEFKKLQFQLTKRNVLQESGIYVERKPKRAGDLGVSFDELDDQDEEEPTPDYLKEAKRRLKLLERETETFEDSVRRYQQKSIDSSSMAVWQAQAASSAYVASYRNRNEDAEPRINTVRWADNRNIDFPTSTTFMDNSNPAPTDATDRSRINNVDHFDQSISRRRAQLPTSADQLLGANVAKSETREQTEAKETAQEDDWETKLRKREEERRKRDEEFRRQQEEELKRIRENEGQSSASTSAAPPSQQKPEVQTTVTPAVDPVLQKYMQLVLEQRQKEKEPVPETALAAPVQSDSGQKSSSAPAELKKKEEEVEVASIKEASSESDFDW